MTVCFPSKTPQTLQCNSPLPSSSVCSMCEGRKSHRMAGAGYLSVCWLQQPEGRSIFFHIPKNFKLCVAMQADANVIHWNRLGLYHFLFWHCL